MKPPDDMMPEQRRRWVEHMQLVLAPTPEALEWYALWQETSNLLDDMIDRDVVLSVNSPCELARLQMLLTAHPFYQRHSSVLGVVVMTLLAMYEVSLNGDKDREMSAWVMAEASRMIPIMIVLMARGYDAARQSAEFMRQLMGEVCQDREAPSGEPRRTPVAGMEFAGHNGNQGAAASCETEVAGAD